MADLERLPIVQNIEMPNQTTFRLPGDAIFSTSAVNTPNVERFEGDEQGVLEPSPDTLGTIYVVPTPLAGKGGTTVEWEQIVTSETAGAKKIATITIDNVPTDVYAIGGGGGGSEITVTPVYPSTGEKSATITIDGTAYNIYAPKKTEVTVTPIKTTGEKIASIDVDGNSKDIYATKVSYSQQLPETGAELIGKLTIDGTEQGVYGTKVQVVATATEASKVKIADIKVNGTAYPIYSDGLTEAEKTGLITLIEAL